MKFAEALAELLEKYFGGSQENNSKSSEVEVTKSLDEEKRMALFVVLSPDEVDLHGDIYNEVEVEKACNNFNTHCMVANLFHKVEVSEVDIVQSFITPAAFKLDTGVEIKKGTWLQWLYFPETELGDEIWAAVKSGEIDGLSIGAMAIAEDLE